MNMKKLILAAILFYFSLFTISAQKTLNLNAQPERAYKELSISNTKASSIFIEAKRVRKLQINPLVQELDIVGVKDTITLDLFNDLAYNVTQKEGTTVMPQWVQTNGPEGGVVRCMVSKGSDIFAGVLGGGLYHSSNNGQSWSAVNTGLTYTLGANLNQVSDITSLAINGNTLFAGTWQGGRIYVSSDNGQNWTTSNSGLTSEYVQTLAVSGNNVFAGTYDSGIFLSSNNGQNWTSVNTGLTSVNILSMAVSEDNIFAGTSDGGIFLSSDNGQSWSSVNIGLPYSKTNPQQLTSIYAIAINGNNIFAGTFDSGIFLSTNNGLSWSEVSTGLPIITVMSIAVNNNNIFVGTYPVLNSITGELYAGGIFLSTNNGQNWVEMNTGLPSKHINSITISGDNIFVGTNGMGICNSTNNGQNWSTVNSGIILTYVQAFAFNETNIFAGTDGGGVFRSANNGQNWSAINSGLTNYGVNSLAVNGDNVFVGTQGGGVFLSTNNGQNWLPANIGITNKFVSTLAVNGNNIFAGTYNAQSYEGGLFLSSNNGQSWVSIDINTGLTDNRITSLAISDAAIFAGTYGGGIFRSTNNGQNWSEVNTGLTDKIIYSLAIKGNTIFAGTWKSGVFRSTDNGQSWFAVGLNGYSIKSLTVSDDAIFAGILFTGDVFISKNNGEGWSKVNAGLDKTKGVGSLAINGENIFAGIFYGGVWTRKLSDMIYDPFIQQDSLALVALYNATDGPNWKNKANWLIGPIEIWEGVSVEEGRVVNLNCGNAYTSAKGLVGTFPEEFSNLTAIRSLSFARNQLSGTLPEKWSTFANLQTLILSGNQLTGILPISWSTLVSLQTLSLGGNQLTGILPTNWSTLVSLRGLYLGSNQLTGNVPESWSGLVNLRDFYINNNRISGLPNLSSLTNLSDVNVSNNMLDFGDIEPNIGVPTNKFLYSPQAPVGMQETILKSSGEEFRISITVGGQSNKYQWLKNGSNITGATEFEYVIPSLTSTDAGVYTCEITNTVATELTLTSYPITLQINQQPVLTVTPSNQDVGAEAGTTTFDISSNVSWTASDDADWLTLSAESGSNDDTITATYTANAGSVTYRVANILFSGSNISISVTVSQGVFTSIEEIELSKSIKLYPNPAKGEIVIDLGDLQHSIDRLILINSSGHIVRSWTKSEINSKMIEIPVYNYKPGMYYLNIITNEGVLRRKVLVIK